MLNMALSRYLVYIHITYIYTSLTWFIVRMFRKLRPFWILIENSSFKHNND